MTPVDRRERRHPAQEAFLRAITLTLSVKLAAAAAGISRLNHYNWLSRDPSYRPAFNMAWETGVKEYEARAAKRAEASLAGVAA